MKICDLAHSYGPAVDLFYYITYIIILLFTFIQISANMLRQHNPIVLSFIGHPVVSPPLLKMSSWVVNRKGEPQYRRHFLADNSIFHGKYQIETYTIFWHLHVLRMDTRGRCIAKKSASSNIRLESDCKANTTKPPYYCVKKESCKQLTQCITYMEKLFIDVCVGRLLDFLLLLSFFYWWKASLCLPWISHHGKEYLWS